MAYGKHAKFIEGDGNGDVSVKTGPIGNAGHLNVSALRETPVELWDNITLDEMHAEETCPLDVSTTESLPNDYKSLPAGAKRITEKHIEAGGGAALKRAALAHSTNLAIDLNAEARAEANRRRPTRRTPGKRWQPPPLPRSWRRRRPPAPHPPRNGSGRLNKPASAGRPYSG